MTCTDIRESISARLDGEPQPIEAAAVHRHLAECADCRAFETEALRLRSVAGRGAGVAPAQTDQILAAANPLRAVNRRRRDEDALRLGLVFTACGELLAAVVLYVIGHGYNGEDHAGHESLSFTIALCVGLLYVAARPRQAGAYLPLMSVAVALLGITAVIDVSSGRAGFLEELPHVNLLASLALLWLLAHGSRPPGRGRAARSPRPVRPAPAGHRLRLVRVGLAVAGALVVVALGAAPASAHAVLEASNPAPEALLPAAPRAVVLTYDEPVTTLPTSLRVYGPDGNRVDTGVVNHPGGHGEKVSIGLRPHPPRGTYLVSWRVISADSHPVSGAFTFSVGDRSAAPEAKAVHTDRGVALALGVTRVVGYSGCALLVGGLAFLALCWRAGTASPGMRRLLRAGALSSLVAAVAALLLKGPYDAALGFGSLGHGELLHETLGTSFGKAVVARAAVALVALILLLPRRRSAGVALGLTAVALVATFPFTGHANAGDQRALAFPSDLVHVAAMSCWLGGLVALTVVALRSREDGGALAAVAGRFSRLALVCVAALVLTGTYQAWRQVRAWGALTATTYGRELLVKIALVAAIVVIAWFSRAWVRRNATTATPVLAVLRRNVMVELVLALAVIGVTSALVVAEPARVAYHPTVAANLTLGPDTVQVSAVPAGDRAMDVHLYEFDKALQPTDPAEVTAAVTLNGKAIGPLELKLRRVDVGHHVARLAVPVGGVWTLTVYVRTTKFDEYSQTVDLPIR